MKYKDLREFIVELEKRGDLVRIKTEVDPNLEMTEIADRTLRAGGPALLFENPKGFDTPVLANLFGTEQRVALGMGEEEISALRDIGELLAYLRQPDPPKGMRDLVDKAPILKQVLNMGPSLVRNPPCQYHARSGDEVDLYQLPIQTCCPGRRSRYHAGRGYPGARRYFRIRLCRSFTGQQNRDCRVFYPTVPRARIAGTRQRRVHPGRLPGARRGGR